MKYKLAIVPISVILTVGLMLAPLPEEILNLLLVVNLTVSILLLLASIIIEEPTEFTALPFLLLASTLFRLSLNISTTRLILGGLDVPDIVSAFGEFVAGGSLVVGLVIFIIISVIQFLVIAKGAERIAEVSARFTLDALPGKQMAIDSDLRGGLIDPEEARIRRESVYRESKLYGALDGAMKFVKGDVIAGLFITVINIVAGLLTGVLIHHFSLSEAVERYIIFSIGDGLISQIPALLVAVAAGVVVTRVNDKTGAVFSSSVISQITHNPLIFKIGGGFLILMAAMPGFPKLILLFIGGVLIWRGSRAELMEERIVAHEELSSVFVPKSGYGVVIRLSPPNLLMLNQGSGFLHKVKEFREKIYNKTGVIFPELDFELNSDFESAKIEVLFDGKVFNSLEYGGLSFLTNMAEGGLGSGIEEKVLSLLEEFSKNNLLLLVDLNQTRKLLSYLPESLNESVNLLIPNYLNLSSLSIILKQLVADGISIKNLKSIIERSLQFLQHAKEVEFQQYLSGMIRVGLYDFVRGGLVYEIKESLNIGDVLAVAIISPQLDKLLVELGENKVPLNIELEEEIKKEIVGESFLLVSTRARMVVDQLVRRSDMECKVLVESDLDSRQRIKVIKIIGGGIMEEREEELEVVSQRGMVAEEYEELDSSWEDELLC